MKRTYIIRHRLTSGVNLAAIIQRAVYTQPVAIQDVRVDVGLLGAVALAKIAYSQADAIEEARAVNRRGPSIGVLRFGSWRTGV